MESPSNPDRPSSDGPAPADAFGFHLDDESWIARMRACNAAPSASRLGSYELLEEIGRGGQGVVYKARQPRTERVIAIKRVTAAATGSASFRIRFEREVRAAAALNHPHIVTIYGCDVVDEQPILLMEYIEGAPVDRWAHPTDGRPRDVPSVLRLFEQICRAVSHAHQRGIIHRDLKPSNVLIDAREEPHVLDFGLARILSPLSPESILSTHTTGFVGTPAYASPEHFSSDADEVDVRSDIYSIGAMLYQALTNQHPFANRHRFMEFVRAVEEADPPPPSKLRRELSADVDAIVLKALSKSKARRYQSMDGMADDIERFLTGQPVLAHPPGALYQLAKLVRRHRLAFSLSATLVALIVAFGAVGTTLAIRERDARRRADWNSYVASIAAANAALRAADAATAQQQLNRSPVELRNWEWRYLRRQSDVSIKSTPVGAGAVAVDGAGEAIEVDSLPGVLTACEMPKVAVLTHSRAAGYRPSGGLRWWLSKATDASMELRDLSANLVVARSTTQMYWALFSPDEQWLAMADHQGSIFLAALPLPAAPDTGELPDLVTISRAIYKFPSRPGAMDFRPDSRQLALTGGDGLILLIDVNTGEVTSSMSNGKSPLGAIGYSPDGTRLAAGAWDKRVTLWDLTSGEVRWSVTGPHELISAIAFARDGTRLAAASWDKGIYLFAAQSGERLATLLGHTVEPESVGFLNSTTLASYDRNGVLKIWRITNEDASVVRGDFRRILQIANIPSPAHWLAVLEGPDGEWKNQRISLVDVQHRLKARVLWEQSDTEKVVMYAISASPVGRWLAVGLTDGSVLMWRGEDLMNALEDQAAVVSPAAELPPSDPQGDTIVPSKPWVGNGLQGFQPISMSFSADGTRLAVARFDGTVDVWDVESREMRFARHGADPFSPSACAFLGNDRRLAVVRGRSSLRILGEHGELLLD